MKESYQRGADVLEKIDPGALDRIIEMLQDISPEMAEWIVSFAYGDVWARPGLDLRTKELITIAALVTKGGCGPQLKAHIQNAVKLGCSKEQIIGTIMHMCVYAGFPAALNGLFVAREIFGKK